MGPDPWLTFWLACGGLLASLASGFAAIWALTQKHRFLPKPLIIGDVSVSEFPDAGAHLEGRWLRFRIDNKGDGVAHDVHLYLCNSISGEREIGPQPMTLNIGDHMAAEYRVSASAAALALDGSSERSTRTPDGAKLWLRMTWRQAPRMHKVRRRVFRP